MWLSDPLRSFFWYRSSLSLQTPTQHSVYMSTYPIWGTFHKESFAIRSFSEKFDLFVCFFLCYRPFDFFLLHFYQRINLLVIRYLYRLHKVISLELLMILFWLFLSGVISWLCLGLLTFLGFIDLFCSNCNIHQVWAKFSHNYLSHLIFLLLFSCVVSFRVHRGIRISSNSSLATQCAIKVRAYSNWA